LDKSLDIVVIVPVFNESVDIVSKVVESLLALNLDIIIIDDGSPNAFYLEKHDRVLCLKHLVNQGQGAALFTGMRKALEIGYNYCVHFDSDGQHNPKDILKMYSQAKLEDLDVVLGSRFLNKHETLNSVSFARKFILKVGVLINFGICGLKLSDSNNGFRIMNRKAMMLMQLKSKRMAHASEIIWLIAWNKLKFKEMHINIEYSKYSLSKGQTLLNSFVVFFEICEVILMYIRCKFKK
jgi:glycosyltransferase involved in cell wall biosynthesis